MNYRYKGFISYSSKDAEIAEKLQRYLEYPEMLGIKEKIGAFFRDRSDLAAGDVLDDAIKVNLEESEWLIIVCSPNVTNNNTSGSAWVERECDYFINHLGRTENFILLISPTSPKDSDIFDIFPKPVLRFQNRLAADARENKDGWHNSLIKIISKLLNKSFRELISTYTIYNAFQNYLLSTRDASRLISAKKYRDAEEKLLALVTANQYLDFRNIEWRYLLSQCNKDIGCYFFNGYATSAAIHWEPGYILIGTNEGFIYIFDTLTGNKIFEEKAHEGIVEKTLFKSETEFITSGKDNYLKVWSLNKEFPVHTFYKKPDLFRHLPEAFREFYTINKTPAVNLNDDGLKVARITGSTVTIWDISNGNSSVLLIPELKFDKLRQTIDNWHSLAFYKDNVEAVFICCHDEILGWNISNLSLFVQHKASKDEFFLGFSSDGKLVVKRIGETVIQICDVIDCKEFSKLQNNEALEMDFVRCEKNKDTYNLVMLHKQSGIWVWTINKGKVIERKPTIFDTGHIVPGDISIKKDSIIYIEKNKHNKVVLEYLNNKPFFMENIFDIEISSDKKYSFLASGNPENLILLSLDKLEAVAAVSETYIADLCFDVDAKKQLFVTAGSGKESIDIYNFDGIRLNTIPIENYYETSLLKLLRVYCTKIIVSENSRIIAGCSDSSIRIFNFNESTFAGSN
jgi:WD40 repeat protein